MAALIFVFSSIPTLQPPEMLGFRPGDKLLHCLEYAVFGFLLFRSARVLIKGVIPAAAAAAAAGILYGLTDEFHQLFVPGRQADPADWAADAVGAALGVLLTVWLQRRKAVGLGAGD